jgi:DNA-binding transcriptional LysR family regulator
MSWDDFRYMLALAKAGSLARAAKDLKVDHTTVGRRVEALEADLGVRLFARTKTGYVLTAEAEAMMPELRQVEEAVLAVERCAHARDRDKELEGTVTITSAETFSAAYLAPRLVGFRDRYPGLEVSLAAGAAIFDLGRRQADVAVRFFKSKDDQLVLRRVAEMGYGVYVGEPYIERRGVPTVDDLKQHDLIGYDGQPGVEDAWFSKYSKAGRTVFSSNLTLAVHAAIKAGMGVGTLPCYLGDADSTLRRVPVPDAPSRPLWLTVHRDLQNTRRVRVVLDFLSSVLSEDKALLRGLT